MTISAQLREYRNIDLSLQLFPSAERDTVLTHLALSPRQQRVAMLAASGLTIAQIADTLYVARSTVKNHLSVIYTTFDVDESSNARVELARRYIRVGNQVKRLRREAMNSDPELAGETVK